MRTHSFLFSIVTLIVVSLVISSVSAAPAIVNTAQDDLSTSNTMYPGTPISPDELTTMLKNVDYTALHSAAGETNVNQISIFSNEIRGDIALDELTTHLSSYSDGYYNVVTNDENQPRLIANIKTVSVDGDTTTRKVEIGVAPTRNAITVGLVIFFIFVVIIAIVGLSDSIYRGYSSSQTSPYFKSFTRHTIGRDGYQYLSFELTAQGLCDYLNDEAPLLAEHPGATLVLNLKGHGWVNNNEVIAQSYSAPQNDPSLLFVYAKNDVYVYANRDKCGALLGEWRQLKWMGVYVPNKWVGGEWYDVVWGSSYIFQK